MQKHRKVGLTCGVIGFAVGASMCGAAVATFRSPPTLALPSAQSAEQAREGTTHVRTFGQRIILRTVKPEEMPAALRTMGVDRDGQLLIQSDVEGGRYRLLWLTVWDWDARSETEGDTISIYSGDYRRAVKLQNRRNQIAIPEPKAGYLEVHGERTEDGTITISLLSGAQPIALPRMAGGDALKIEIETAD